MLLFHKSADFIAIPSPLSFIKHDHMFGWRIAAAKIIISEVMGILYERSHLAPRVSHADGMACFLPAHLFIPRQRFPQDRNQWTVSG
jgi:hypothetical protein